MTIEATEINGLVAALDPSSGAAAPLIHRITKAAGADDGRLIAEGLGRAARHLAAAPVRVTVGGHFSSGKSSLINMLIGTPLLPTDELPETGVPCLLRSGAANRVLVRTGEGVTEIPFNTEAIAGYVSLIGEDGGYRDSIRAVQDVRVILGSRPIPADATWVDSPGINDVALADVAAALARAGDILVWVVNSRQPLAMTEQEFLAAHMAETGPASVVFVINAFLGADTEQDWEAFTAKRARYDDRVTQNLDTAPVPARAVIASARAAASHPDSFGGPQARALLASISDPSAPRVAATRLFRAVAEVRKVIAGLDSRVAAEERRVADATREAAEREKARGRQRQEFLRTVRREIASVLSSHDDAARRCADQVISLTSSGSLESARYYGDQLDRQLRQAMSGVAYQLKQAINRCAREHGHRELGSGDSEIDSVLAPDSVSITGSGTGSGGPVAGGATAGAVIGGIVGSLFFGFGAPIGAAIGGAIGASAGSSAATDKQRDAIQAQLSRAGSAATARMLGAQDPVARAAERNCAQKATPAAKPDQARLKALRDARSQLETNMLKPLTDALTAAQARASG